MQLFKTSVLFLVAPLPCFGRTWTDIPLQQVINPKDSSGFAYLDKEDPNYAITLPPTPVPTIVPIPAPTRAPTVATTRGPTQSPTTQPTTTPATPQPAHSSSPTTILGLALADSPPPALSDLTLPPFPSLPPVSANTSYPWNPPPSQPDPSYFNYDTRPTAKYGPGVPIVTKQKNSGTPLIQFTNNGWRNERENSQDSYWVEFTSNGFGPWKGTLESHNPLNNLCENVGNQSPIDLRNNSKCLEHHQIRPAVSESKVLTFEQLG